MNKQDTQINKHLSVDQLTFEDAFSELEEITRTLETDGQTLDQALALFERGQELHQHCATLLDKAELKIQQILGDEISDYLVD